MPYGKQRLKEPNQIHSMEEYPTMADTIININVPSSQETGQPVVATNAAGQEAQSNARRAQFPRGRANQNFDPNNGADFLDTFMSHYASATGEELEVVPMDQRRASPTRPKTEDKLVSVAQVWSDEAPTDAKGEPRYPDYPMLVSAIRLVDNGPKALTPQSQVRDWVVGQVAKRSGGHQFTNASRQAILDMDIQPGEDISVSTSHRMSFETVESDGTVVKNNLLVARSISRME